MTSTDFLGFPEVPDDRIAQTPLPERDEARLMVLNRSDGSLSHKRFRDLPDFLSPGDVLVMNDAKVFPARLLGRKPTGGRVKTLLLKRFPDGARWTALLTPSLKPGASILFDRDLSARVDVKTDTGEYEHELKDVLLAHNTKEEAVLYPAIDRCVSENEAAGMVAAMQALPAERYAHCCTGTH